MSSFDVCVCARARRERARVSLACPLAEASASVDPTRVEPRGDERNADLGL